MTRFLPPILLLLLLAVTTVVGWGGSNAGDPGLIKIVSSLPRTGSARAQTDSIVNGFKMAFAEAGYRVGRFQIEYADWDDATAGAGQWTAEAETANASRAVRDPDVMIYPLSSTRAAEVLDGLSARLDRQASALQGVIAEDLAAFVRLVEEMEIPAVVP